VSNGKKSLRAFRKRLKEAGMVRLEVTVRRKDVPLLRRVVSALADPMKEAEARAVLRDRFAAHQAKGLKALLAAAPLEGIDLERIRDTGRAVDL
jgi:hypothetical protein